MTEIGPVLGRVVIGNKIRTGIAYDLTLNSKHVFCLEYLEEHGPTTYHHMVKLQTVEKSHQLSARLSELKTIGAIRTRNLGKERGYEAAITSHGRELLDEHRAWELKGT